MPIRAGVDPHRKSDSDKRHHPRHARRIPCEIYLRGARHSGIVKDVSRGGLFVQTRATAAPGTAVTLVIAPGIGRTEIRVTGRVARSDRIRAHLAMQSAGGLGIEVTQPVALGRLLGDLRLTQSESEPTEADGG